MKKSGKLVEGLKLEIIQKEVQPKRSRKLLPKLELKVDKTLTIDA